MISPSQLKQYFDYLRFPTVSADPASAGNMDACADWLVRWLADLGFSAQAHCCGGPPIVLARCISSPGKRTVLIYGHYDVQPTDPLPLWRGRPFEPRIEDGLVIARGATDNKGQAICHLLGTEAMIQERGELPVNLIYVLEGEEEIGSPSFGRFLESHRDELCCDTIVISDTSMAGPGSPAITTGLRGIACLEIRITGTDQDLHSGIFGGAVANPAQAMIRLLQALHHPDGSIAIPGFYDGIFPVKDGERQAWQSIAYTDETIRSASGAAVLCGEPGFTGVERTWIRPTAEINGLTSGYQGHGSKTIIPSAASAKLSFRLLPGQDPDLIVEKASHFLRSRVPEGVQLEIVYDHGGAPFHANPDSPDVQAASLALQKVFGRTPVYTREGLSIPVVSLLQKTLLRDPILIGLGYVDCQAHAPNESFPLEQLAQGIRLHQALLDQFAAVLAN